MLSRDPHAFVGESDASHYSNYLSYLRASCRKGTHFHHKKQYSYQGSAEAILLWRFRELLVSDERICYSFKGWW